MSVTASAAPLTLSLNPSPILSAVPTAMSSYNPLTAAQVAAHQQYLAAMAAAVSSQSVATPVTTSSPPNSTFPPTAPAGVATGVVSATGPNNAAAAAAAGCQQQASTTAATAAFNVGTILNQKDSRWLQLEVCREYQRNKCTRSDIDCKFAHPPENIEVQNGRVTACYDSIKGRCNRDKPPCKYFHPPQHLKDQLLINGRNHLALKNAVLQQYGLVGSHQPMFPMASPFITQAPTTVHALPHIPGAYAPAPANVFYPQNHMISIINPTEHALLAVSNGSTAAGNIVSPMSPNGHANSVANSQQHLGQPSGAVQQPNLTPGAVVQQQVKTRSDRIEVCREFQRGACKRGESECRYAHPPADNSLIEEGGFVTICMDHEKGRCAREPCRYFHRPDHLKSPSASSNSPPAGSSALLVAAAAAQHQLLLQQQQQQQGLATAGNYNLPSDGLASAANASTTSNLADGRKRAATSPEDCNDCKRPSMQEDAMKSQFSEQDHSNKGTNASGGGSGGNASTTNSNLIPQARSNDQRLAAALSYQNALLHQLQQPNYPGATTLALPRFQ